MKLTDSHMLTAALTLAYGCKERQGCTECPLRAVCGIENRHKPPEEWKKLLIKKSKLNRKGGDHTKKEEP